MKKSILIVSGIAALIIGFSLGKCSSNSAPAEDEHAHAEDEGGVVQEYTCSMHPQVRTTDKNAKCPLCFMDLIPVPKGADDAPANAIVMTESAMKRAQIEVATVIKKHPRRVIQLVGTVETDETEQATITAWFPGRIDTLHIDYTGAPVRKGDPLAELYSPELLVAQSELQEAASSAERIKGNSIVARTAKSTYQAARRKLIRWGLTEEQIDALAQTTHVSDHITISAPIDGVVLTRNVATGEYVKTGQTLFQIANLDKVWVLLAAHESDLPFLTLGQDVDLETDLFPGLVFSSKIEFIDPVLDPKTRTATVRLSVQNEGGVLLPGAFVRGNVIGDLRDTEAPLLIPRSAVLKTGRRAVVFVQIPGEKPTFESRVITLGERGDEMYVVIEGLKEGEIVVVQGAFKIDSELQIQAKPSMMSIEDEPTILATSDDFIMTLTPLYSSYFVAQESLAADNFEKFIVAQSDIELMLTLVDDSSLSGESLTKWRSIASDLLEGSKQSKDISDARVSFESMSKAFTSLQNTFGHADGTYYQMFCPMAFDNKGAFWLQRHDSLNNPYYGASMLKCGETKNVFSSNGGDE